MGSGGYLSGTSMAAPHVAAGAALLILDRGDLNQEALKNEMFATTNKIGTHWNEAFGYGILDFRIHLGEPVSELGFWLYGVYMSQFLDYITTGVEIPWSQAAPTGENIFIKADFFPFETTNKSLTLSSSNPGVATCVGVEIIPQGYGTTTITVTTANGLTDTFEITIVRAAWIDYAAASFAGGTGSASQPFLIETAPQLAKIAYDAYVNDNDFANQYFKLMADINLAAHDWFPIMMQWERSITGFNGSTGNIMTITTGAPFKGNFDGNYFIISNMKIGTGMATQYFDEYYGLFGFMGDNTVKNLKILDADIIDGKKSGILAGRTVNSIIENCWTVGSARAGLIGRSENTTIRNSLANITLNARAGLIEEATNTHINNSFSTGDFIWTGNDRNNQCAGIAVWFTGGSITNTFSTSRVLATHIGENYGFIWNKQTSTISRSYFSDDNRPQGIRTDGNPFGTQLSSRVKTDFTNINFFRTDGNWNVINSAHRWDFQNTWAIYSGINGGYPHLLRFYGLPKEATPSAGINHSAERLEGLTNDGTYKFNGIQVDIEGTTHPIDADWLGAPLSIIKVGDGTTTDDSFAQTLNIPARLSAPTGIDKVNCTRIANDNGSITGVTSAMEYRGPDGIWRPSPGLTITGLAPGTYQVRLSATSSNFVSLYTEVTIYPFNANQEDQPNAGIDHTHEQLTGLIVGGRYTFNGGEAVTIQTGGRYIIPSTWLGSPVVIVKLGNGTTTLDSEPQHLNLPARLSAPTVGKTDCTTSLNNNGTITGVTPEMEYRLSTGAWITITGNTVANLTPGTYHVRIKATSSNFASNFTTVTINNYTPTGPPGDGDELMGYIIIGGIGAAVIIGLIFYFVIVVRQQKKLY
jgi:hypothetical protein